MTSYQQQPGRTDDVIPAAITVGDVTSRQRGAAATGDGTAERWRLKAPRRRPFYPWPLCTVCSSAPTPPPTGAGAVLSVASSDLHATQYPKVG